METNNMKIGMKKPSIFGVIALFISISFSPIIGAMQLPMEEQYVVNYAVVNPDGTVSEETALLNAEDLLLLQNQLSAIVELFKTTTDQTILLNSLFKYLDGGTYPILSKIIQYFLSSELLLSHKLVVSEGWGYDLNPLKKTSIDMIRPVTLWIFLERSDVISIPCNTVIVQVNPMQVKTYTGSQIGCMFRFRGLYVHIPQQVPMQSFTFFLGTARNVLAAELPTVTSP